MGTGFLQDDKGNKSATRLVMVVVFFTFCLAYLAMTGARIVMKGELSMLDVPGGVITFAGLVWAGKEIQKLIENKGAPPPAPPPAG